MPENPSSPSTNPYVVQLESIEGRLTNPKQAMDAIGMVLVAASQKAFEDKEFGTFKWPKQYENQPAPWLHKAGVAADLAKGEGIKSSRYGQADTLKDSGNLSNSISVRSSARYEVQVGTTIPYAKYHQWGSDLVGPAVQPVTNAMRVGLQKEYEKADEGHKEALKKMFSYFKKDSITTHIRQRPFLGITDEIESDIRETIVMFMESGSVG